MKKFLKILNYENLIYLMILMSPILDVTAFLFREKFPNFAISPSTVIRPIIPLILIIYIFVKENKYRFKLFLIGLIYLIYGFIHLYLYKGLINESSFGTVYHEAQYIINYTFNIIMLIVFYYGFDKYKLNKIHKILFISLTIYIFIIYLSLITNTSSSTYLEGIGYKSWFSSGNALGSILLMLFSFHLSNMKVINKKISLAIIFLTTYFLIILLGTKTGILGYILTIFLFISASLITNVKKHKKNIIIFSGFIIFCLILITIVKPNFMKRTTSLEEMNKQVIDPYTLKEAHVTGDSLDKIIRIKNNQMPLTELNLEQQESMLNLYDTANKYEIKLSNRRALQLIYHIHLIKHQTSLPLILFGNGYLINYNEMCLEMELLSIPLNFGIIGSLLYLLPFIVIFFIGIKKLNFQQNTISKIIYIWIFVLSIILSTLAGYTFFNLSSSLLIIISLLMLRKDKKI